MPMPTLHVLAPFHTIPNDEFSHCAFTGKAIRFAAMMKPFGYRVIEYANEGSTSAADEKVAMLTAAEYQAYYKPETSSPGAQAQVGSPAWWVFQRRLEQALRERAQPGDIVCHIWTAHEALVPQFPGLIHVETGIGYPNDSIGNAYRIFESEAWRNYHWGRIGTPGGVLPQRFDTNPARCWVVPNYYDPTDWPLVEQPQGNNVAFMGRFVVDKGIDMLRMIIKAWHRRFPEDSTRFVLAGMGDYAGWVALADFSAAEFARIDYRGAVLGRPRAELVGNAKAFLLPSTYVEPFGGAGVEAMLTGTPLIAPTFGAFCETVRDGVTGSLCRTVDEYVTAIALAPALDRAAVHRQAAARYSLQACGRLYDKIFRTLTTSAAME